MMFGPKCDHVVHIEFVPIEGTIITIPYDVDIDLPEVISAFIRQCEDGGVVYFDVAPFCTTCQKKVNFTFEVEDSTAIEGLVRNVHSCLNKALKKFA